MGWKYRAVKERLPEGGEWYSIREAYYAADGKTLIRWSEYDQAPGGETLEELTWALTRMLESSVDKEILDLDELQSGKPEEV